MSKNFNYTNPHSKQHGMRFKISPYNYSATVACYGVFQLSNNLQEWLLLECLCTYGFIEGEKLHGHQVI